MYKRILALVLAAAMVFCLAACSQNKSNNDKKDNTSAEQTDITVCLDWTPNTNHTGMYVAQQKGYYEAAGLNVTIVQPPESGAVQACAAGQAQFAVDAQDTMASALASDTPLGITAVAALIAHNTSGIMTKSGEGMDTPKGLTGKTYLTWDVPTEKAMMKNVVNADGGNWDKVNVIPNDVTDEAQDVKQNPDHAIWVFYGWGGINAEVNKIDTDFFYFKDVNKTFDYYTPVLIANNDFISSNPKAVKAFLAATKKGYEYAISNPDAAADILIKSDETGSLVGSEELVTKSQQWLADKYIDDSQQWGYISPERWNGFYSWLWDNKLVDKELPANTGFTNDYLS